jgi:Protein of unknown function (DUF1573)
MKVFQYIVPALIFAGTVACKNEPKTKPIVAAANDSSNFTTVLWLDTVKQFGKIKEGEKLQISFRFKNTGDKPLVVNAVRPGCGCTGAHGPTEPLQPGAEGVIEGEFDSNGKPGHQRKSIYITMNTKEKQNHEVIFEGDVEKKPDDGKKQATAAPGGLPQ